MRLAASMAMKIANDPKTLKIYQEKFDPQATEKTFLMWLNSHEYCYNIGKQLYIEANVKNLAKQKAHIALSEIEDLLDQWASETDHHTALQSLMEWLSEGHLEVKATLAHKEVKHQDATPTATITQKSANTPDKTANAIASNPNTGGLAGLAAVRSMQEQAAKSTKSANLA